ncbi:MAG: hypothetical protein MJ252_07060 [archaeon]|nr:hypothetical protein [archaeon]
MNYYKNKKPALKTREREFSEQTSKKGGEISKMDISIQSKNILDMNEQLKDLLARNEINNYSHFKISS